ncbi:uncharacterized protein [Watersipora subatra]|uniref:uncharacterized protein n=1 Tax=Watersipora subatra TaxID=2589382 RepID=UPI00355B35AE
MGQLHAFVFCLVIIQLGLVVTQTTDITVPETTTGELPTTTLPPTTTKFSRPMTRRCKCEIWAVGYDEDKTRMINVNYITLQFVRTSIPNARCSDVSKCGPVCKNYKYHYFRQGLTSRRTYFSPESVADYVCTDVGKIVTPNDDANVQFMARMGGCSESYKVEELSTSFCCKEGLTAKTYTSLPCDQYNPPDAVAG